MTPNTKNLNSRFHECKISDQEDEGFIEIYEEDLNIDNGNLEYFSNDDLNIDNGNLEYFSNDDLNIDLNIDNGNLECFSKDDLNINLNIDNVTLEYFPDEQDFQHDIQITDEPQQISLTDQIEKIQAFLEKKSLPDLKLEAKKYGLRTTLTKKKLVFHLAKIRNYLRLGIEG
jgi:hypothetical protein